jgi:hypothetical protein
MGKKGVAVMPGQLGIDPEEDFSTPDNVGRAACRQLRATKQQ